MIRAGFFVLNLVVMALVVAAALTLIGGTATWLGKNAPDAHLAFLGVIAFANIAGIWALQALTSQVTLLERAFVRRLEARKVDERNKKAVLALAALLGHGIDLIGVDIDEDYEGERRVWFASRHDMADQINGYDGWRSLHERVREFMESQTYKDFYAHRTPMPSRPLEIEEGLR